MGDEQNTLVLSLLYNTDRTIHFKKFYYTNIRPNLTVWDNFYNKPYILDLKREQIGGQLFGLTTSNGKYGIEVERLTGSYVNDGKEEIEHKLYFFHPEWSDEFRQKREAFRKHCCLVIIYDTFGYGELKDLNNYNSPCFETVEQLVPNMREGHRVVRVAIEYCRKYKASLGIDYLELGDNATYYCDRIRRVEYGIRLSVSRQLLGQYPYYWQFGFRPSDETIEVIERNLDLINSKTTSQCFSDGSGLMDFLVEYRLGRDVTQYVADHVSQSLVKTLKFISNNHCKEYRKFYDDLFGRLGLRRIGGDDVYTLRL
jgi:hypothetical protein